MIKYKTGSFGFALLFRLHGSAVFKSVTPALVSTGIFVALYYTTDLETDEGQIYGHPYVMGALVSALTFLLAFRANFSYNRYWEAFTAVHQMHSKWMDVGMDIAAFHLQSNRYEKVRPPAFGEHPELTCLERERERLHAPTLVELEERIDGIMEQKQEEQYMNAPASSLRHQFRSFMGRSRRANPESNSASERDSSQQSSEHNNAKQNNAKQNNAKQNNAKQNNAKQNNAKQNNAKQNNATPRSINKASPKANSGNEKGGVTKFVNSAIRGSLAKKQSPKQQITKDLSRPVEIVTDTKHHKKAWEEKQPPLLLQEAAHLLSLLSAVAFSTLRNDLEEADSPLIAFTPGAPWPHVDPDSYHADVRKDWAQSSHRTWTVLSYLFGTSRTPAARTLYNAARPFRVFGGVSDAEIEVLQAARGPYAKVALCTLWLEEFISREHLNQGLGAVGAPIVSRLYQFTSDGMLGYNQARKVAYIPFPFPHAQITSLFVAVVVALMPVMMIQYCDNFWYGIIVNLFTVMCFTGLHEVARELENPFQNVPNDIPLNNFQAQFNEGLLQMFAGFHPDAYWEIRKQITQVDDDIESQYPPPKERLEEIMLKGPVEVLQDECVDDGAIIVEPVSASNHEDDSVTESKDNM